MRTTIDLPQDAYRLAKVLAKQKNQTLGKFFSDLLMNQFRSERKDDDRPLVSEIGFPLMYYGRPITTEDVKQFLDEE